MQNIRHMFLKLLAAVICCNASVQAVYHSNFEMASVDHIKKAHGSHLFKFGTEFSFARDSTTGYDDQASQVNALQIYTQTESARNMLIDPNYLQILSSAATTNFPDGLDWSLWGLPVGLGTSWGDMKVTGKVKQASSTMWGRVLLDYGTIPGQLFMGIAMPICSANVDDVAWEDQTDATADGARNRVWKTNLTSKIEDYVQAAGDLNIRSWSKRGLGDARMYFGWGNSYARGEGAVSKIDVHASIGLSIPTGYQKDYDVAFSIPFGLDGSWGVPLNIGYNIVFGDNLKLSANTEVMWLSAKTKEYRLKTDLSQTDYLILTKGKATKKPGTTWNFDLQALYKCSDSCNLSLTHNLVSHQKDVLSAIPECYDLDIVNSLKSLQSYMSQDLTIRADFEGRYGADTRETEGNEINFSVFYTIPLSGKQTVKNSIIGGELHFSF
jgi:hypothetical protein